MSKAAAPLVVTPGEPAGIGPDLLVQWAQAADRQPVVVVANAALLQARADQLGLPLKLEAWQRQSTMAMHSGQLIVCDVPLEDEVVCGHADPQNAAYVLNCLDRAIEGTRLGEFSAMVTGPVHKGVINEAGIAFSGHTEYLQHACGVDRVVMMLATRSMKVALVTTHLPLREVAEEISAERLRQVLDILIASMQTQFACSQPRILVAGLNPHAGECGHLGHEEQDIIEPVLQEYKDQDVELIGPLPADTLFTSKHLDRADAVLAMYHDQGLPVLKYQGFGEAVNITLGLPMIRTSVDHGTALDLAGTGKADIGSLSCAIEQAAAMAALREKA